MKKIIPFLCSKVPGIDFKRRYGIEMKKKGGKVKIDLTLACCSNRTARCSKDRNEVVAVVDCCCCCPWWLIGEEGWSDEGVRGSEGVSERERLRERRKSERDGNK